MSANGHKAGVEKIASQVAQPGQVGRQWRMCRLGATRPVVDEKG